MGPGYMKPGMCYYQATRGVEDWSADDIALPAASLQPPDAWQRGHSPLNSFTTVPFTTHFSRLV
jgi:hypothetical protein